MKCHWQNLHIILKAMKSTNIDAVTATDYYNVSLLRPWSFDVRTKFFHASDAIVQYSVCYVMIVFHLVETSVRLFKQGNNFQNVWHGKKYIPCLMETAATTLTVA
jgi:hypothetical protein